MHKPALHNTLHALLDHPQPNPTPPMCIWKSLRIHNVTVVWRTAPPSPECTQMHLGLTVQPRRCTKTLTVYPTMSQNSTDTLSCHSLYTTAFCCCPPLPNAVDLLPATALPGEPPSPEKAPPPTPPPPTALLKTTESCCCARRCSPGSDFAAGRWVRRGARRAAKPLPGLADRLISDLADRGPSTAVGMPGEAASPGAGLLKQRLPMRGFLLLVLLCRGGCAAASSAGRRECRYQTITLSWWDRRPEVSELR
jgi:hypothetical protein